MLFAKSFEQMEAYLTIFAETQYHKLYRQKDDFSRILGILRKWKNPYCYNRSLVINRFNEGKPNVILYKTQNSEFCH